MNQEKKERLLLFAMLLSMFIWGMSWSSAKVLSGYGSASAIAFIRFLFVPITLFPLIKYLKMDFKIKAKGIPFALLAGLFMLLYSLFFFGGLQHGEAGKGGVLVTTINPIIAYLIGLVVSRIVPSKAETLGLLLGIVAGVVLLNIFNEPEKVFATGNVYFIACALTWSIMSKFSAQANRFGTAIVFSFWMNIIVIIGLLFVVDFNEVRHIIQAGDTKFWLNIVHFGIINTALATTCFLYATAHIGAEKASSFMFIVPSMALIGSWLFLDEKIHLHTIIGGIIGIVAVFIINGKLGSKK